MGKGGRIYKRLDIAYQPGILFHFKGKTQEQKPRGQDLVYEFYTVYVHA